MKPILPKRDRSLYLKFICNNCGNNFHRKLRRVYAHAPTLVHNARRLGPITRNEFIFPRPIECSKCGADNQSELDPLNQSVLRMSTILRGTALPFNPEHPLQVVTFTYEGKPMHPLDALDHYQDLCDKNPDNLVNWLRCANILGTIGQLEEAETHYRFIIEKNSAMLEAWLNLAAIAVERKQKRAAKKALKELIANASKSTEPNREILEENARGMLDGKYSLDDLSLDIFFVPAKDKELAGPTKSKKRTGYHGG